MSDFFTGLFIGFWFGSAVAIPVSIELIYRRQKLIKEKTK
jgi:hypothetical protein